VGGGGGRQTPPPFQTSEGTPVELVRVEDIRNGGDLFEAAEQTALDRELDASIAEADAVHRRSIC
jgi:hypothetical protein